MKLEIVISDDKLDKVIETIKTAAHTGKIGDGKIFVSSIEQAVRIRTSEKNDEAL
jgi:nitrogen regulatory protein PII